MGKENAVRYIAEVLPIPISAYSVYLESKYRHEVVRDVYLMDMLRFAAFGMVKERDRPPRYWELVQDRHVGRKDVSSGQAAAGDFDERDVIAMFRGEGRL